MAIEIRAPRDDEMDRVHYIVAMAFTADRSHDMREKMKHVEELAPTTVLLDGGEIVASLKVYPFTMRVNGAPIGMGGVSGVSCLPEARRKGHVGALLRHALAEMRDAGQPLSALYTPHPALYRKYGYMVAGANLKFSFHPKRVQAYNPGAVSGHAERVTEEQLPQVEGIYERFSAGRTGQHVRSERWWREAVFRRIYDPERKLSDVALWRDANGEASGYVAYEDERGAGSLAPGKVWVREFVALTGSAYQGLLRYLLSHDLAEEIWWYGGVEDPLAYALDDSHQVKREYADGMMLRVVDVEKAVAERPAGPGAPEGAFTIALTDAACPWNTGTWRIESAGGALSATKTGGTGDLSMEAATFAGVYDGFTRASDAVRSGLAEGEWGTALLADRVFASLYPPLGSDFF